VTAEAFRLPLYEYQCPKCGRFELIRKFSDPALTTCPTCGSEVQKLFSAPAIQFKGTGWYITDYARKSDGKGGKGDSAKGEGGASEAASKGEGPKSEGSKSEASKSEGSKSEGAKDSGASSGNKAASSTTSATKTGGGSKSS
jgi:putative FmdB family regulatory protein